MHTTFYRGESFSVQVHEVMFSAFIYSSVSYGLLLFGNHAGFSRFLKLHFKK